MKKCFKQILSVILVVTMIFSIVPMGALSASAIAPASTVTAVSAPQTKAIDSFSACHPNAVSASAVNSLGSGLQWIWDFIWVSIAGFFIFFMPNTTEFFYGIYSFFQNAFS